MGRYITPTNMTKEAWVEKHAKRGITLAEVVSQYDAIRAARDVPMVLVDNGVFKALGVGVDKFEVSRWSREVAAGDTRPMRFFVVSEDAQVE